MINIEALRDTLKERGFSTSYFDTASDAAAYLNQEIDGVSVGIGGSVTVQEMGLYDTLSTHNQVVWHWASNTTEEAVHTDVYLSSVNGVAETGELINIDGNGNRVASTLFGHKKVYLIIGTNKIAPNYEKALWRARNIAAPLNAKRLQVKTPCAALGDKCYDCHSPARICKALVVLWEKPNQAGEIEVVIVGEKLGY